MRLIYIFHHWKCDKRMKTDNSKSGEFPSATLAPWLPISITHLFILFHVTSLQRCGNNGWPRGVITAVYTGSYRDVGEIGLSSACFGLHRLPPCVTHYCFVESLIVYFFSAKTLYKKSDLKFLAMLFTFICPKVTPGLLIGNMWPINCPYSHSREG